jgi:hypothetical protein
VLSSNTIHIAYRAISTAIETSFGSQVRLRRNSFFVQQIINTKTDLHIEPLLSLFSKGRAASSRVEVSSLINNDNN